MFDTAAFGPFIGDWKYEVFVFRPYIKWVLKTMNINKVYVSSHINRLFLYDNISEDNLIPVYEDISRNELLQTGPLYKNVTRDDYSLFVKLYKEAILKDNKSVNFFQLNYTKFFQYPLYCRYFSKIEVNGLQPKEKDYYLFIPDDQESFQLTKSIYSLFYEKFGEKLIVCGDMKTHLNDENVVLAKNDYFENGYKYIMSYIDNAKAVICPLGFWTFLVNIQNKPVYSWATDKGNTIYRNILVGSDYCLLQTNDPKHVVGGFLEFIKKVK